MDSSWDCFVHTLSHICSKGRSKIFPIFCIALGSVCPDGDEMPSLEGLEERMEMLSTSMESMHIVDLLSRYIVLSRIQGGLSDFDNGGNDAHLLREGGGKKHEDFLEGSESWLMCTSPMHGNCSEGDSGSESDV